MENGLPAQPNQSLLDGLTLLTRLAASRTVYTVSGLADELGFEVSRTSRLLKTLAHLGFAYRTHDRRYGAGAGIYVLAAQSIFGNGLVERILPEFEKLSKNGYMVAFGVLWGDVVSYLFHWTPGMDISDGFGRVGLFPAVRSSIGISLLSLKDNDEIRSVIDGAQKHAVRPAEVERRIQKARESGMAEALAARATRSIAVPVGMPAFGALALSNVPLGEIKKMRPLLLASGAAIAKLLTGR